MGGELVSVQRREASGNLILRVVDSDRLPAMLAEGWEIKPETDWVPEDVPQVCVLRPLYNDNILNIKQASAGERVPLSGTRKQQLGEAQRQLDQKYGEGRMTAEY